MKTQISAHAQFMAMTPLTAPAQTDGETALRALLAYSAFARAALERDAPARAWLLHTSCHPTRDAIVWPTISATLDIAGEQLRALRTRVMLHTMLRDFMGAPTSEITDAVTALAAFVIPTAQKRHSFSLLEKYGDPGAQLITVGMGKLGGEELNVSSDIDIVFVFPEDGETRHRMKSRQIDRSAYFAKLAAASAAMLDEVTANGFVFRVDTRLRPYGSEGPLAVSIDFLEQYFFEQARFWERLAWLRSASITGDTAERLRLRNLVRPFVFRRYLDFDAYNGLRELHGKIRAEGQRFGGERNIKLGRGGIRELEFFVQVQQLVRGGRDASLQVRQTVPAIGALERARILSTSQAAGLRAAYPFLRRLEHFLQYEKDAQTQTLPEQSDQRFALAQALGFDSLDAFEDALARVREFVAREFDNLSQAADAPSQTTPPMRDPFRHWAQADEAARYFGALQKSPRFAALPALSQTRISALLARVPESCAATTHPFSTLKRWGDLLETICGRSAYLALLDEHPQLLAPVTRVLAASEWAAQYLRDHPILLDELLDARTRQTRFSANEALVQLQAQLSASEDIEHKLDTLRRFQQTEQFRILLQDLDGTLAVEALADDLSALADVCVQASLSDVWAQLGGGAPFPPFAVIAYGRWGGKELGYGSDLDLVFLVDDDVSFERCAKLAQRLQSWLTTHTTAGQLYEIDTRLRPDGEAGMLLSAVSAFRDYQKNKAWRWEHQALSRARFAAGDARIGAAFEAIRAQVLTQPKSPQTLKRDIADMRERMRSEKAGTSDGFDVKNDAGGMVDIEFIVQALVLEHAKQRAFLLENKGNIALLLFAGECGLLPARAAANCANAYREFRAFQHQSRLANERRAIAPLAQFSKQRDSVQAAWKIVFSD